MQRLRVHLTYANVMATIAVFIALVGIPTAVAVTVDASKTSDVNKKGNIRPSRVTTVKLADANVTATKLAGIQIVRATGAGSATASCPAGTRILSGGAVGGQLLTSAPSGIDGEGNGWSATVTGGGTVKAYAFCLK